MLSRRLLLGLPSRLPGYRRISEKSTSIAGGQVRPAGVVQMCPPERGKDLRQRAGGPPKPEGVGISS